MFERIFKRGIPELTVCAVCNSDFVYPVEWSPHDDEHWWMLLRCGACGDCRERTVSDRVAERFDRELDRAQAVIRRAADRLNRERLADQARAFATALELDLIGAEDFAIR